MSSAAAGPPVVLEADVGIVGAGPAGLGAAVELARKGLLAVVLDEGHRPGGQIFRQLPPGFAVPKGTLPEPPSHRAGHTLLEQVAHTSVRIEQGAVVWDSKPGRIWFEQEGRSRLLRCRAILLATGAYDRCVPFPGWTLPGVITAGACQVLVRGFAVQPGTRALVAGSGPLLLPTITALLSAGVTVVAALEACASSARLTAVLGVLRSRSKLREAFYYGRHLLQRRVKLQWGSTVFAVEGEGRVQRAVIGKVDEEGRPMPETAKVIEVDLVCAGFGLVPSVELGLLLGCKAEHRDERGGWHLHTDERTATSVAGVWAAGEIAGIGGSDVAIAEGRLAAAAIEQSLRGSEVPAQLVKARAAARRSADGLLRAFRPLPRLVQLVRDDTVICRCEDVRAGELRAAAALHGFDVRGIKMGTRAGMGPCQARICGPSLQAVAAPGGVVQMDCPVAQVPVKPVAVRTILEAPAG